MQQTQIERKSDTRRKIQIGGLVIKAGLDHLFDMNEAILLGALLEVAAKAKNNEAILDKWQNLGIQSMKKVNKYTIPLDPYHA